MKVKKLLTLITLVLLFSIKSFAQGECNFWFFGENAGLDFNSGSPVALTVGALNTSEGCTAISDASGNLLFYTDGIKVWNRLHVVMPNGNGLHSDLSSTQAAIIVPKPGSSTIYYIFTTSTFPWGLSYSEVDMTLDGGKGNVTAIKNSPLYTPTGEKITAVKNSNNVDFWVIAHDKTTADFLVYAVTAAGVSTSPVISTTGTADISEAYGYLKASADGSKLVSAIYSLSTVEVFDFNTTTGVVTFNFNFSITDGCYGVEFSPDGSRLYVAAAMVPGKIYQYDMTLGSAASITASGIVIGTAINMMGALQNAPDGKLYATRYDVDTIACITNPNALGIACGFVPNALSLAGRTQQLGLPNFIPGYFRRLAFNYVNTCMGDTTLFLLFDSITVDSIHWNFGDTASGINNTSNTYAPYHIFSGAGSYNVSVITYYGSGSDTSSVTVGITGSPIIFIGNDTSVCIGDSITIDAGTSYIYRWQDGSVDHLFRAAAGGSYYVTATNTCGTGSDTINIPAIPLPDVIVNDQTICIGQTANLTAHGAATYSWQAGLIATDSTAVNSPTVTTSYSVTGTSEAGCIAADTFTVIVNLAPVVSVNAAVICTGDTARLIADGANSYLWSTTDTTLSIYVTPVTTASYSVIGTDTAGCMDTATTTVTVNPLPVITITGATTIVAGTGTTLQAQGGVSYNWSTGLEEGCNTCADIYISPSKNTTYCVVVNDGSCTDSACVTLKVTGPCEQVQVPDAFSPNNDGTNDYFLLQGWTECVNGFFITIYDRWGEKVVESTDVNFRWDGMYKNKVLAPAVFVYYIKAQLMDGTSIERKGNITLIR